MGVGEESRKTEAGAGETAQLMQDHVQFPVPMFRDSPLLGTTVPRNRMLLPPQVPALTCTPTHTILTVE